VPPPLGAVRGPALMVRTAGLEDPAKPPPRAGQVGRQSVHVRLAEQEPIDRPRSPLLLELGGLNVEPVVGELGRHRPEEPHPVRCFQGNQVWPVRTGLARTLTGPSGFHGTDAGRFP